MKRYFAKMHHLFYAISMKIKVLVLLSAFLLATPVRALDPKVKIMGTMAIYGTAGGALLGLATLAFDGEGRNVAKGASLGLYAGLLFGSYVIISHIAKRNNWGGAETSNDYYGAPSPYEDAGDYNRMQRSLPERKDRLQQIELNRRGNRTNYYLDLLQVQF